MTDHDPYTSMPTHLRVWNDGGVWFLDGADDEKHYTESCWSFDTYEDAIASIQDFIVMNADCLQWRWIPGRRGAIRFRAVVE